MSSRVSFLICSCWCAISTWSLEALARATASSASTRVTPSPYGDERRLQRVDVIGEITARIHANMKSQMLVVDF